MTNSLNPSALGYDNEGGGDFECVTPGVHVARLVGLAYIGEEENSFPGKDPKMDPTLFMRFETPNHLMSDGRPKIIDRKLTFYYYSVSNLTKFLTALLGRKFDGEGADKEYNIADALGLCCQLQVVEHIKGNKDVSSKIDTAMALPEGTAVPDPHNDPWFYSVTDHNQDMFEKMPNWVKDIAKENLKGVDGAGATPLDQQSPEWWGNFEFGGSTLGELAKTPGFAKVLVDLVKTPEVEGEDDPLRAKLRAAISYTEWTLVKAVETVLEDNGFSMGEVSALKGVHFADDVRAAGFIKSGLDAEIAKKSPSATEPVSDALVDSAAASQDAIPDIPF